MEMLIGNFYIYIYIYKILINMICIYIKKKVKFYIHTCVRESKCVFDKNYFTI